MCNVCLKDKETIWNSKYEDTDTFDTSVYGLLSEGESSSTTVFSVGQKRLLTPRARNGGDGSKQMEPTAQAQRRSSLRGPKKCKLPGKGSGKFEISAGWIILLSYRWILGFKSLLSLSVSPFLLPS